jgi:Fic family protein
VPLHPFDDGNGRLTRADTFQRTLDAIARTAAKSRFWHRFHDAGLLPEQMKILNRLLDNDFDTGIKATQHASVAKVPKATATRHLAGLFQKGAWWRCPVKDATPATCDHIPFSIEQLRRAPFFGPAR